MTDEQLINAWHEAGHAVAFGILGVPCTAKISPTGGLTCMESRLAQTCNGPHAIASLYCGLIGELLLQNEHVKRDLSEDDVLSCFHRFSIDDALDLDRQELAKFTQDLSLPLDHQLRWLQLFCSEVMFTINGLKAVLDIATELQKAPEVHVRMKNHGFFGTTSPFFSLKRENQGAFDFDEPVDEKFAALLCKPRTWLGIKS